MKWSQSPIGIVIGLTLLAVILFVVTFTNRPSPTGQAVLTENGQDNGDRGVLRNFIEDPFSMGAWVVNSEGVKLDIKNNGVSNYTVESLAVENCGIAEPEEVIVSDKNKLVSVKCTLEEGEVFSGEIIIIYREIGNNKDLIAKGFVEDLV